MPGRPLARSVLRSVPTHPQHRTVALDALAGAQHLFGHPSGRSLYDTTQATLVEVQQQADQYSLKRTAGLDDAQDLDGVY
jgi:hypothetical protein